MSDIVETVIENEEKDCPTCEQPKTNYSATTYIKTQDLIDFNMYLATMRKPYGIIFGGILFLVFGVHGFIVEKTDNLKANVLLLILGVISLLYAFIFNKIFIKKRIKKLDLSDMPPVEMVVSEDGILYRFEKEEDNLGEEAIPFAWNLVSKVVILNNHVYVHMVDYRTVLLLIKSDVENTAAFDYLKDKMSKENKWIEK